jgi:chemotaxis protein methyltransferase CheR
MPYLVPFKNLIREKCGLCFEDIRTVSLREGIETRMSKSEVRSHTAYFELLFSDSNEFHRLINLLTINETYFFREPVHLQLLVKRILPALLADKKAGEKVRIVSAGCSTGEEPYSLAMAIMEEYGAEIRNFIAITGFDIDTDAIAGAEEGVFTAHSFRNFSADLQAKYFEQDGTLYRIRKTVRQKVGFLKHNLLSEEYPSALQAADVVFYRNVSIYFEPETQKNIFTKLAGILKEGGYLFVSSTETLSHNIGVLSLVEMDNMFLYRKSIELALYERRNEFRSTDRGPSIAAPLCAESPRAKSAASSRPVRKRDAAAPICKTIKERRLDLHSLFDEALLMARAKQYDEALGRIRTLLEQDPSFVKAYMLKAGILVNMKRLDEAQGVCLQSIGMDQWCLEGYLILGLIAKIRNDDDEALKRFKEALYIQSSCWLAHFYLGDIYRSRGEWEKAGREYEIVAKLLKKGDLTDHGLTFFPLSFPVEQVVHLCAHNLAEIRKRLQ